MEGSNRPAPASASPWPSCGAGDAAVRIAVVDDDDMICRFVSDLLQDRGYETASFPSAEAILEELKSSSFDLVLLDLRLPGMDGIEALRSIKDAWPQVDVIILTGFSSVETAVTSMQEGAADYIPKPASVEHILVVVEKTLYRRELERKARERDRFEQLSKVDGLTEAYNHRFFQEILDVEITRADRYGHDLALLMIDVDDFKLYNDLNGHQAGDRALRNLAAIMKEGARASDYVARYGGEEFAIVLTETDKPGARVYADRMLSAVARAKFENEEALPNGRLTVSVGLAAYTEDAASKDELVAKADEALYQAKRAGRNRVVGGDDLGVD